MGRKQTEETKLKISNALKGRRVGNAHTNYGVFSSELRMCPTCKIEFSVSPYKSKKYCSLKCASVNNGGLRPNCGKKGSWYFCKYMNKDVYLDSTWELEYAIWLDKNNIKWNRPSYFNWTDINGKPRRYYPDFYLIEENKYIDIKNDFLIKKDKYKIDNVIFKHNIELQIIDRRTLDNILAGIVQK